MTTEKPRCENCDHMKHNPYIGYCYMFKSRPKIVDEFGGYCAQHTDIPKLGPCDARAAIRAHFAVKK